METATNIGSDSISVHVIHTGSVYIDRALAFRKTSLHPMPYTGWLRPKSKKLWVPVSAYLVDHPDGRILVDTGWHTDIRENQRKHLGLITSTMFKGRLPEGDAIHEQLASMGIANTDLDYVVLSHLDSDHVSGVKHVKGASNIIVSEPEWNARDHFRYIPSMWDGVSIDPFPLEEIPYGPYNKGLDFFGDGQVYLVFTPGHSAGQVSVLINNGVGWILLANDVGYAAKSWEGEILPGLTDNDDDARASLQWVSDFSQRDDCIDVLVNHDIESVSGEIGTDRQPQ